MSLWTELKESQERTLQDKWNFERMRMERGMVIRIMTPQRRPRPSPWSL